MKCVFFSKGVRQRKRNGNTLVFENYGNISKKVNLFSSRFNCFSGLNHFQWVDSRNFELISEEHY